VLASVLLLIQGVAPAGSPAGATDPRPFETTSAESDGAVVAVDTAALEALTRQGAVATIERFPLDAGTMVDLRLQRFRVTGPDTRFVVGRSGGDDEASAFDPDRVLLMRGEVVGEPDSHVFLAMSPWGSIGRLELGDGGARYLMSGEGSTLRIGRRPDDAEPHPGSLSPDVPFCGTGIAAGVVGHAPQRALGAPAPEVTQEIELAVETDYELFELFGDLDATGAYVIELWGAVSDIYQRDLNARIELTFVRLWDDPDDLFNAEDPLQDFVAYWQEFMTDTPRDVAQFVSGRRNMPYGGVAYLEVLCSDFAYGVVGYMLGFFDDPSVPSVWGYDVHVTAHELGHNCAALHTPSYGIDTCNDPHGDPQRSTIMSYCSQTRSGGNANTDLRFHAIVQEVMEAHIFSVDCVVDDCNGNGTEDAIDISVGGSSDNNGNGIPDECEDCNDNGILDPVDIGIGTSDDDNGNGVPDECEPDCNRNGQPDDMDIALGVDTDLYGNNVPDGCEDDCNGNGTSDYTEIQADMSLDIDRNAVLDACQDCDDDGTPDLEALAGAHNTWVASSVAGSPIMEFHAVTGVRVKTSGTNVVSNPQDLIITATGRILVSSANDSRVVEFDGSGAHVGDLVAAGSGGLDYPTGMVIGPNGNLFVCSRDTDSVLEYDAGSGAPVGPFVAAGTGGLTFPFGIAFGPNGNLFVTSLGGRVLEYDGGTGAFVGDFVTAADNGGLLDGHGVLFKPDGNLLVASLLTNQILEYDGTTGAFVGQFNNGGTDEVLTLDQPWSLRLGPDGDVYASRHLVSVNDLHGGQHDGDDDIVHLHVTTTRIYIFDVDNGMYVGSYVTGHDTELSLPTAFDFMPGDATDCNFNQIPDTCDIDSGFSDDNNGNGTPDECESSSCPGDLDGDGEVGITDFLALLAAWGPNPGHPADLDGDDEVGVTDFLALLAVWGPCP
jgi:hypothetical protein